jgi:hypothetical protein
MGPAGAKWPPAAAAVTGAGLCTAGLLSAGARGGAARGGVVGGHLLRLRLGLGLGLLWPFGGRGLVVGGKIAAQRLYGGVRPLQMLEHAAAVDLRQMAVRVGALRVGHVTSPDQGVTNITLNALKALPDRGRVATGPHRALESSLGAVETVNGA